MNERGEQFPEPWLLLGGVAAVADVISALIAVTNQPPLVPWYDGIKLPAFVLAWLAASMATLIVGYRHPISFRLGKVGSVMGALLSFYSVVIALLSGLPS